MNTTIKNTILLIIRIATGAVFAQAGFSKLMDIDKYIGMFSQMGLNETIFWLVAIGEVLAGLGILFGVYTRISSIGLIIIMIGALIITKFNTQYLPSILPLIAGGVIILCTGSGKYAIIPSCTSCSCKNNVCKPETSIANENTEQK